MADTLLSDRLEAVRDMFAKYVHDGVAMQPEAVTRLTAVLSDLKRHADSYEQLMDEAHDFLVRRPLTEEQLADPKIVPFPTGGSPAEERRA